MAQLNLNLPSFSGIDLSDEKQLRKLTSYLYKLDEQLRYVLANLGEENLSDSLRTVINTKSDATVLGELTGQLQRLSTQIVQTAEAISLKADKETLDALGETLSESVAEFELTAEEIRSEVSDTASGLQSQIDQQAGEITLSVQTATNAQNTANSAASAATNAQNTADGKLDADAPAVGVVTSGVTITEDQVKITSPETVIAIPGADGETMAAQFDEDGLTAAKITCPNVAPMYDGPNELYVYPSFAGTTYLENGLYKPGDAFVSLKDALASLSYKTVPYAVTIYLGNGMTEYGNATLAGCIAAHGITIRTASTSTSSYATLHGKLEVCYSLGVFYVQYMRINPPAGNGSHAIHAYGNGVLVSAKNCIIRGTGSSSGSYGMCADDGAKIFAVDNEIYNCECSLVSRWMGEVCSWNNKGNCVPYIENATARFFGTAPSQDSSFWYYLYGAIDVHQSGVTVDQGTTSGTASPTLTTGTYLATSTASYKGSGSSYRTEVGQGWWDGIGRIRGCMWFDNTTIRSNLSGRTIRSATLRLSMRSGVGRGASVTVELSGTVANSGASSAAVTKSYGAIGTTSPGEVTTITIPNDVITDLKNGTINGLMLYSSDTGAYKERSYSKNYAMFDGAADSTPPVLTVVYS